MPREWNDELPDLRCRCPRIEDAARPAGRATQLVRYPSTDIPIRHFLAYYAPVLAGVHRHERSGCAVCQDTQQAAAKEAATSLRSRNLHTTWGSAHVSSHTRSIRTWNQGDLRRERQE